MVSVSVEWVHIDALGTVNAIENWFLKSSSDPQVDRDENNCQETVLSHLGVRCQGTLCRRLYIYNLIAAVGVNLTQILSS